MIFLIDVKGQVSSIKVKNFYIKIVLYSKRKNDGGKKMHLNIGDIVFQLFTFLIPIILIILLIVFVRSSKKRNQQLKRIEEKLDKATEQKAKNLD
jgi:hypothetical protein